MLHDPALVSPSSSGSTPFAVTKKSKDARTLVTEVCRGLERNNDMVAVNMHLYA